MESAKTRLGALLEQLRRSSGKTQEQVARALRVNRYKISLHEQGAEAPSISEVLQYSNLYELDEQERRTLGHTYSHATGLTIEELVRAPRPAGTHIFDFARRLSLVRWFPISPVIDITYDETRVSCRVTDPRPFHIAAPENTDDIIREVIAETDQIDPHDARYGEHFDRYQKRLREGNFATEDAWHVDPKSPTFDVFTKLVRDTRTLVHAKREVLKEYLTRSGGFHFNGKFMALTKLQKSRRERDRKEEETINVELQETDYFSYRIMTALSDKIRHEYGLEEKLSKGFSEYTASPGVQRNIHLSFGIALYVHTLVDNRVIITRRSAHAANPAGEAGLYFLSANEGWTRRDLGPDEQTISLRRSVERAIEEEIAGRHKHAPEIINRIERCTVTGAVLYLPNLSVNLGLYVGINCSSKEMRDAYFYARDGQFETSNIIFETQWDEQTGLPVFDYDTIYWFVEKTIGDKKPFEMWDEGALMNLILSTLAI